MKKWFQWGHYAVMIALVVIIITNFVGVVLFSIYDETFSENLPEWFPNSNNTFVLTDFLIYAGFSLLGAILGGCVPFFVVLGVLTLKQAFYLEGSMT